MKNWHYIARGICNSFVIVGAIFCMVSAIIGPEPTRLSYGLCCAVVALQGVEQIVVDVERRRYGK